MPNIEEVQIGDLVRIRERIELFPIDDRAPSEIPAGIFGHVTDVRGMDGERRLFAVEFHEPYEFFNEISIRGDFLEVIFRISDN